MKLYWTMPKGLRIHYCKELELHVHEVAGQIPRMLFGGVKSFVGKIPVGNTGGANVPPLRTMEIPEDLMTILKP